MLFSFYCVATSDWNNSKFLSIGDDCKAAQFRTSRDLAIGDNVGKCALLTIERGTKPQAYRTSLYKDEYLEHQCHNICKSSILTVSKYSIVLPYNTYIFLIFSKVRLLLVRGVPKLIAAVLRFANRRTWSQGGKLIYAENVDAYITDFVANVAV